MGRADRRSKRSSGLRIVGGRLRGRRLQAPPGLATRPTSDRVRESIFDLLGPLTDAPVVLDLFAGSGALGLEALSRGATRIVFVERDRRALATLRRNVETLGVEAHVRIVAGDARGANDPPAWPGGPFDLVLADPPYRSDVHAEIARRAAAALAPDGRFVLERAAADDAPDVSGLALTKDRRYGETRVSLYRLDSEDPS